MSPSLDSLIGSHVDGPPSEDGRQVDIDRDKSGRSANGHGPNRGSNLRSTAPSEAHDLVCVGFGPASLAIAVALHDAIEAGELTESPKVLFLEKQLQFAWHAGMLLPGAKMQISFLKDLATLRNPRSQFTFLNFVHQQGRLIDFINLDTFLPARAEYEDYLSWAASHFGEVVRYGQETISVSPAASSGEAAVSEFVVTTRDVRSGDVTSLRARNVVLAIGGQGHIPECLPSTHPRIIHSSQYAHLVPKVLDRQDAPYRVAVIGAGQSAAEIFSNIQTLYPNSSTYLVMRSEFLKPSDDSPFVNSIFNPSFVDDLFSRPAAQREALIADAKATNYAVVRLKLIEQLYERMYDQKRRLGPDERGWPHRILAATKVLGLDTSDAHQDRLRLRTRSLLNDAEETLEVDLIIAATGYQRTHHFEMMNDLQRLLPEGKVDVRRDYSVEFAPGKVAPGSGVWLQGCNEHTHGLSDTLLSVLATRSAEIVHSIFGGTKKQTVVTKSQTACK